MSLAPSDYLSVDCATEHSALLSENGISDHPGTKDLSRDAKRALAAIEYITDHLKADDEDKKVI